MNGSSEESTSERVELNADSLLDWRVTLSRELKQATSCSTAKRFNSKSARSVHEQEGLLIRLAGAMVDANPLQGTRQPRARPFTTHHSDYSSSFKCSSDLANGESVHSGVANGRASFVVAFPLVRTFKIERTKGSA